MHELLTNIRAGLDQPCDHLLGIVLPEPISTLVYDNRPSLDCGALVELLVYHIPGAITRDLINERKSNKQTEWIARAKEKTKTYNVGLPACWSIFERWGNEHTGTDG